MKPSRLQCLAAAFVALPLLACPAAAQAPEAGLLDALSLLSGGLLVPHDSPPAVTHDGSLYRVRLPVPGLTAPPNAAIEAVATPVDAGAWDITALTLPSPGVLPLAAQKAGAAGLLTFAIGQQTFHARVDPSLATPSPFKARLGKITLRTENAPQHTDQTIDQYSMDGTISGDGHGRMNARTAGTLTNWQMIGGSDKPGDAFKLSLRAVSVRSEVEGLDRARAEHLRTTVQSLQADRPAPAGVNAMPNLSPAMRERLHAVIDDLGALLTRFDLDETIQGLHFDGAGTTADAGSVRIGIAGDARTDRVSAHFDITLSDPASSMVPIEYASLMPRRVTIRPAVSGMRRDALQQWLRDATAEGTDPAAMLTRTMALLNDPDTKVGIETLVIEFGPAGAGRLRPRPSSARRCCWCGCSPDRARPGRDDDGASAQRASDADPAVDLPGQGDGEAGGRHAGLGYRLCRGCGYRERRAARSGRRQTVEYRIAGGAVLQFQ